jgi:hypothetical protein
MWFDAPDGSKASISFYHRGQPVTETSAAGLTAILAQGPHALAKDEIVLLRSVFGMRNVGDNQYTSFGARSSLTYPACQLASSDVIDLNGRLVIDVRCTFQDATTASPINEVRGIYFEQSTGSGMIQQIHFEAPTLPTFLRHLPAFESVLKSIAWD